MELFLLLTALVGFLILILIYRYASAYWDYFDRRGISYRKPTFLLGNLGPLLFQKTTPTANLMELYRQFEGEKLYGFYEFRRPVVMLRDLELVKRVFVKDFDHFLNHTSTVDVEVDSIYGNMLIALQGQKWKNMRSTLSPMFTGNKIRHMVPLVSKCGRDLCEHVEKSQRSGELIEWDVKELLAKCLVEVIGSCAFGIEVNSFEDPDNEFDRAAKYVMSQSDIGKVIKFILFVLFPKICKRFGMELFDKKYKLLFRRLISETMDIREQEGISRPDLVQLLMQAKRGKLTVEEEVTQDSFATAKDHFEISPKNIPQQGWSQEELTAQAVIFFAAGFDTSSTLLSFTLIELALNPDIQDRLLQEIDSVDQPSEELTYDHLQKLTYLDAVISESLRKWPPLPSTDRKCNKDYVLNDPETGKPLLEIEVDRPVWIPIFCFHHDPKYFPYPERFDPDRFSISNRHQLNQSAYMPFGVGPRNCIGSRFALMASKQILCQLLRRYRVELCPKTDTSMELSRSKMSMTMDKGHWVYLKPRN